MRKAADLAPMDEPASLKATVHGQVQGVFFRAFVSHHATRMGLTGYVANIPDGRSVEVLAEGERRKLEELVQYLKTGPPEAGVEEVKTGWAKYEGRFSQFKIRH